MTIAITGVGLVTSLGTTVEDTWRRICAGDRGVAPLTLFSGEGQRTTLVAEVAGVRTPDVDGASRTGELALLAAREALTDAKLDPKTRRVGLVVGGTTAGMFETESLLAVLLSPEGAVDPAHRKDALSRMLSHPLSAPTDHLAKVLGPFARVRSLSSACSSGANALVVGATWLELGLVDAVLCGAADSLCRVTLSGFNALAALDPNGARPFDVARRGLTLGEGAGFVVLETKHAGMRARATLLGWAARSEAHHITNPEPSGEAPVRAMNAALARAGLTPADVDYVNAHATGTPLNDPMESRALARFLGEHVKRVPVSGQKGQIGHTLAAAGAVEAVLTTLAIERGTIPPTGGLEKPDPECPLVHVTKAEERKIGVALSSSFGFGGMDTVLVFGCADREAPRRAPPRNVVITGIAAVTPAGSLDGHAVATLVDREPATSDADVDAVLDPERARRLDRASRLAAVACGRALGDEHGEANPAGIVLGSAFGAVDATSAFMRRLQTKGPRLASPADFPSLVPSSPAGHVSIYHRLEGPGLVVADLALSGEAALVQAAELVAAGDVDRMCAVAVEERSTIVEQVLAIAFGGSGSNRREGAAAIAIAAEGAAPGLARLGPIVAWTNEADTRARIDELGPPPDGAIVVLGSQQPLLDKTRWSACKRIECAALGTHEAAGGLALAIAAAMIARGDAPMALFMGTARGSGYAGTILPRAT